jgi:hypothetical protein
MTVLASVLLAPALMGGALLDRILGPRGDALDNVIVAVKPDGGGRA